MKSLLICLVLVYCCAADFSQADCQENEVFVYCGQCETTCGQPRIDCSPHCRLARCECLAKKGFVRSIHGHCIRFSECPGPSIYSMDKERGGKGNIFREGRKKRQTGA